MDDDHTPMQPSRRNIFAAGAALAVMAAAPPPSPDADLLRACRMFIDLELHRRNGISDDADDEVSDLFYGDITERQRPLVEVIVANPPTTSQGIHALVHALFLWNSEEEELDYEHEDRTYTGRLRVTLINSVLAGRA